MNLVRSQFRRAGSFSFSFKWERKQIMTRADKGKFFQKHPGKTIIAGILQQGIAEKVKDNKISCAAAEAVAFAGKASFAEIGEALDLLNISIVECQLGLFGYGSQKKIVYAAVEVASSLQKEIKNGLVNGRLPCAAAWEIARKWNLPRMKVSAACEKMQIKIKPCQLGAF